MGIHAGFDMVPRLTKGVVDRHNWNSFIEVIKKHYENDELVVVKPNYLEFKVGEHPLLPFEGHKFLRFSSKISGSHAQGVGEYIATVTRVAHANFGSRVRSWNDCDGQGGIYGWSEVNESCRSYEQRDEPEIPTSIAQFVFGTDPISELNLELFETKAIPGKGKGLVARFNIAKGKRILLERPILTTPNFSPISIMETRIAAKLKSLSKAEQRKFLSLHNNFPGKHPFSGIVKTNALPCGPDSDIGGVYPTISLINHSCVPNAHHNWNDKEKWETIHATTFIKAGEEITIGYKQSGSSESRRASLKESFGFDCTCSVCSLSPLEHELSDARRLQIEFLDDAIGRPERVMSRPDLCLVDCRFLLQALETEYKECAYGLVSRLYYDAFQICITHGDQARAAKFAERGYKARIVCEGEDSVEALTMKKLIENPAEHRNFGVSKRWRTGKGMAPRGLDDVAFEKWLWRLDH